MGLHKPGKTVIISVSRRNPERFVVSRVSAAGLPRTGSKTGRGIKIAAIVRRSEFHAAAARNAG